MKFICMGLALFVPAFLIQPAWGASTGDEAAPPESGKPRVIMLRSATGEGDGNVVVEVEAEGAGEDGEVVVHGLVHPAIALAATPADPNRGWLGVQLAEVPAALAKHLPTGGGTGTLVGNVVTGSPADQAGLEQYDVITAIDGKSVTGDLAKLSEAIGSAKPGSQVTLKVIREGAETTLTATLASRPSGEQIEWKYELSPEAEIHESFKSTGKIIRRDKDGNIVMEDLGDLKALKNLPDNIKDLIPRLDQFNTQIWKTDEENRTFSSVVTRDGVTIKVKQEDGGPIEVERTDEDGNVTTASYETAEALAAADAEAHEIYQESQGGFTFQFGPGGGKSFRLFAPGAGQWREEMEQAMREARESMAQAREHLSEARKRFEFRFRPGHPFFSWNADDGTFFAAAEGRSFRVNPDGQIEVTIRKGENEVIKVFKDEADLQARDPELYQAFAETQSAEEP